MHDIGDFAEQAATQFLDRQKDIDWKLNLMLDRRVVEEFIRTVFYASLIPDEGRWPSVCLMCYRQECEQQFHFLFDPSMPPTPPDIAKLAHAVDAGSHLCCICSNRNIELGGIHVTMLNKHRELGYGSFRVANPLKLRIRGPGHIEVSTGGTALVYNAGEISEESLLQHSEVIAALAKVVEEELREITKGTAEILADVFNDIAESIVRLGHGGIILMAKDPSPSHFSSLKTPNSYLLQQVLLEYWYHVRQLLNVTGSAAEALALAKQDNLPREALKVVSSTLMLEETVQTIAHLAGVDGAIVMSYDCKVFAFNAIIKQLDATEYSLINGRGEPVNEEDFARNRGSRHQSALRFAKTVPHSFALVVSQDGSISAFHNDGHGKVLCEIGMRVLE